MSATDAIICMQMKRLCGGEKKSRWLKRGTDDWLAVSKKKVNLKYASGSVFAGIGKIIAFLCKRV